MEFVMTYKINKNFLCIIDNQGNEDSKNMYIQISKTSFEN